MSAMGRKLPVGIDKEFSNHGAYYFKANVLVRPNRPLSKACNWKSSGYALVILENYTCHRNMTNPTSQTDFIEHCSTACE